MPGSLSKRTMATVRSRWTKTIPGLGLLRTASVRHYSLDGAASLLCHPTLLRGRKGLCSPPEECAYIQTGRNMEWLDVGEMVKRLNQQLGGWANHFKLGPVTPAYRFIDRYTTTRLRRWLCKKHKQSSRDLTHYPDEYFYQKLGLICLPMLPQNLPWAKT